MIELTSLVGKIEMHFEVDEHLNLNDYHRIIYFLCGLITCEKKNNITMIFACIARERSVPHNTCSSFKKRIIIHWHLMSQLYGT